MNTDVIHLVREQLLDLEEDLCALLQLELGKLDRLKVDLPHVVGDLRLKNL